MTARGLHRRLPSDRSRARIGMTLIEVMVATFILTGVILVLGGFSAKFAQANAQAHLVISANDIAAARLDEARAQTSYDAIGGLRAVNDLVTTDNTVFHRTTTVRRMGGVKPDDVEDYQLVTVVVWHDVMKKVVTKTTAIAAY